jgi:hypothetical protein
MRRPDILSEHSRPSQKDIVRGQKPEPVSDPHANIPNHVGQLSRESDINDIYVKRVESARRGLKRGIKVETNEFNEKRDEALELSQTVSLTHSEQLNLVKDVALQKGFVVGISTVDELITRRLQGESPASASTQSKDQTESNS